MVAEELASLRERLDGIDTQVIELLAQRMALAAEVGRAKAGRGVEQYVDHAREAAVIRRLQELAGARVSPELVEAVYREIMAEALARQQPLRVCFLGPAGTFSQEAALARFGRAALLVPQATIEDCFDAVDRQHADHAIVPYENSTEGSIGETLDLLVTTALTVVGETQLRVRQNLLALADTSPGGVDRLYYHPQSYAQCAKWLRANLAQGIVMVPCPSNGAAAAQVAAAGGAAAAIGPRAAAAIYGLQVVAGDIEDNPRNVTRFLVLGRNAPPPSGVDRTSLLASVRHEPGALFDMLSKFASASINMTRLESRPMPGGVMGEYLFFIDVDGHRDVEPLRGLLAELAVPLGVFKVFGSYPVTKAAA